MAAYALRRFTLIIPTLFIVTAVLFIMLRMLPSSVVDQIAQNQEWTVQSIGSPQVKTDAIRHKLGLDVPFYVQYGRWIGGFFQGNFGTSLYSKQTLLGNLRTKLPVTVELSLLAMIFSFASSIPLGIFSAIRQDTAWDYVGRTWSIAALSVPGFWIATLVMIYPAIWWNWSPPVEYISLAKDPLGNLGQFLIPSLIMGLAGSGGTMRLTRTMTLEVLRQDYIRTAWAKGLRERVVVIRHGMKNTLIPVITIIGGMIPGLLGGSVIMEQIFALPGMGRYMLDAINMRDYNIISGWNIFMAGIVMIFIVLTDLAYAFVDPRIRYR